jgi:hypothetical protein
VNNQELLKYPPNSSVMVTTEVLTTVDSIRVMNRDERILVGVSKVVEAGRYNTDPT